jgi:hypothetical protein
MQPVAELKKGIDLNILIEKILDYTSQTKEMKNGYMDIS